MVTLELSSDSLGPFRKDMATVLFPESGLYAVYDQANHEDHKSYPNYHCHSDVNGHLSHRPGRCLVFCWGCWNSLYGCCLLGSHGCCRSDGGSGSSVSCGGSGRDGGSCCCDGCCSGDGGSGKRNIGHGHLNVHHFLFFHIVGLNRPLTVVINVQ